MSNINLIPQSEVQEQNKTRMVKTSTIVSVVIMILSILLTGYSIYLRSDFKMKSEFLDENIQNLRSEVTSLSDIEITARNLDKKYTVLKGIFDNRVHYSLLLKEVKMRKPPELNIESFDTKDNKINISGSADTYISIANFINNLLDKNFEGGIYELKELFISVSLNAVNQEKSSNKVKFFIVVEYDPTKLNKR